MNLGRRSINPGKSNLHRTDARVRRTALAWLLSTLFVIWTGAASLAQAADPQPALVLSACHGMASAAPFAQTSNAGKATEKEREFVRSVTDYMYGKGYERAVRQLTDAITLNPGAPIFFVTRGQAHYGAGEFGRAIEDFNRAIVLDPDSWIAYSGRGESYERMFEHDHAIDDLDRAIQLAPRNARALTFRGSAYLNKQDFDRAIEDLSRANILDPQCAAVLVARGTAYGLQGDRDRARADHDAAIELNARRRSYRGFALRASAYGKKAQYELAISDVGQWQRDPKNLGFWTNLCRYHAIEGAFEKALADCNEALRLQPDDAHVRDNRGFTYLRMGSLDNAIADFDAALRSEPKLAQSLYGRGIAKRMSGDIAGSEIDLASALAIKPDIANEMALLGVK